MADLLNLSWVIDKLVTGSNRLEQGQSYSELEGIQRKTLIEVPISCVCAVVRVPYIQQDRNQAIRSESH